MGFIHGEKGEQGPRSNTCMKQGISVVKNEGTGFENYSLNFEAALFLGSLFKSR